MTFNNFYNPIISTSCKKYTPKVMFSWSAVINLWPPLSEALCTSKYMTLKEALPEQHCISKTHMHLFFFLFNNQPHALIIQIYSVIKFYMLQASSLPIVRSSLLYIQHWWVSCRFLMTDSSRVQMELQFHPDSALKRSSETCMKLTSAECTVENFWRWAEKIPKTCSVL